MKRILVALDASPRADSVITAAARLADLTGAKLIAYRALHLPPEIPAELLDVTDRSIEEIMVRNAVGDLERLTKQVPRSQLEKITTTFATPWDGICRAAREYEVDLVVIGSHGYGGLDRLLGTTAAKVVNHADRNVLVVKMPLE